MVDKKAEASRDQISDYLEGLTQNHIRQAAGFVKGRHYVPTDVSAQTGAYVGELTQTEITDELQRLYETSKQVFGMRRRQFTRESGEGFGRLATKYFDFSIHTEQHPTIAGDYVIVRRLELPNDAKTGTDFGDQLDRLFGATFDKVVIEVDPTAADFGRLVDMFEDLEEADSGRLRDDEDAGRIDYTTQGGAKIIVDLQAGRIELVAAGAASCSRLLALAQQYAVTISGTVNLLS